MRISDWSSDVCSSDLMAPNKSKVGAAAIAAGLSTFFGWFPDAHWTPRKLIDGRTASALTYLLEATLTTDMFGVKAHGQKIPLQGALILHFSGDRKSTRLNSSH